MIRIALTCLVMASLVFAGCDEPAKPPADAGGAAPSTTPPPTTPKAPGAKTPKATVPAASTKPVD